MLVLFTLQTISKLTLGCYVRLTYPTPYLDKYTNHREWTSVYERVIVSIKCSNNHYEQHDNVMFAFHYREINITYNKG